MKMNFTFHKTYIVSLQWGANCKRLPYGSLYQQEAHIQAQPSPVNLPNMLEVNLQQNRFDKSVHSHDVRYMLDKMPHPDKISSTTVILRPWTPLKLWQSFAECGLSLKMNMDTFMLSLAIKACVLNV
ncbi:hypothetical protein CICLE_v10007205mg [Citrus x clementina]|uniref:Uncharacterized protein n=1 Tax=Citrus clementina TaxID=85681 RepID=V4S021_CITCL|nr:hypothetical protein CICLE_v10007205mg [Citrus x clementina]